jgi:hypothetical protein
LSSRIQIRWLDHIQGWLDHIQGAYLPLNIAFDDQVNIQALSAAEIRLWPLLAGRELFR